MERLEEVDVVPQDPEQQRRIVVGVDGSPSSRRALGWATKQARLVGATVVAVTAWEDPAMYGFAYGCAPVAFEGDNLAITAAKVLAESVTEVAGEQDQALEVRPRVMQGHPAQVLLEAARGAQLLVVGNRGHGPVVGMLLGSVSQHCVQHAPCPVVVVPAIAPLSHAPAPGIDTWRRPRRPATHGPLRGVDAQAPASNDVPATMNAPQCDR